MSRSDRHPTRVIREVVLTLGAVVGLICIVATIASAIFGLRPLVFRSGSMSPTISTGALAVAKDVPAAELKVGDIVMVKTVGGSNVTHRIVTVTHRHGRADLALKGDANKIPDAQVYSVTEAQRVWFAVPKLGYVVSWLSGPIGLFLLGLYAAFLLFVVFVKPNRSGEAGGGQKPERAKRAGGGRRAERKPRGAGSRSAMMVAVAVATAATTVAASGPTWAAPWTDSIAVSGTSLSTYTVPKPAITSCTVAGLTQKTATIVWTEVSSPFALDYTAIIVETGQSLTVTDNGSTRQTQFSADLLSTILNQTYNIRINAKLPSPNGSWVSVNTNQPVTIALLGLGMTCGTAS